MNDEQARPTPFWATVYVFILAVLIGLSLLDRQLLAIVTEPIKHEFRLSDTQIGLLTGVVFALVFSLSSIPLAWGADRVSRTGILTVCATFWALCTAASGGAISFTHLAAARMGLAIGEAGCNPCAQSLIADYVPPERRGRAMALYGMGGTVGIITAGLFGGGLTDLYGWRVAFFVLGAISLTAALIAAVVLPEPRRKVRVAGAMHDDGGLRQLLSKVSFRYLIVGGAIQSISVYGILVWSTAFGVRYFHMTPGQAGVMFGTPVALIGLLGTWAGGRLSDWLVLKDRRWMMWMPSLAVLGAAPCTLAGPLTTTFWFALAVYCTGTLARTLSTAPVGATIQNLSPDSARARAAAVAGVTATLVGLGLGPVFVGSVSDNLTPYVAGEGLRYGLALLAIPDLICAYCYWQSATYLRAELQA